MSRAFIKEGDGSEDEELAELQVSPHRNLVTPDGLRQIEHTVEQLRASLSEARATLSEARASEDRADVKRLQRDMRYWTERLRTAEVVPPAGATARVRFGSVVTLEMQDGARLEYRIVGEDESDPADGRISYVSPIAQRLIGQAAGDEIELSGGAATVLEIR